MAHAYNVYNKVQDVSLVIFPLPPNKTSAGLSIYQFCEILVIFGSGVYVNMAALAVLVRNLIF